MERGDVRPSRSGPASADTLAGLYLHIPFCSAVCPYCDFAVQTAKPPVREAFVDLLCAELAMWSARSHAPWTHAIDTVYLGGGTPSILSYAGLERILRAVREALPVTSSVVVSLEANPEDVNPESVRRWRDLGVHTVSLGVQSFDGRELRWLGRRHSAEQAVASVETCLAGGFDSVSVDLMFGFPNQSLEGWMGNLETVAALGPPHISCYQLTIHDGTPFARRQAQGKLTEMANSEQGILFEYTHRVLRERGWAPYEVSNFARDPAHRSRHNQKYWQHIPYLGLGPAAHSFDGQSRWWNHRTLAPYREAVESGDRPIEGREVLDAQALALEAVMLRLRTTEGIDLSQFATTYGVDLAGSNKALIEVLVNEGLIRHIENRLMPTERGLAVVDGLVGRFRLDVDERLQRGSALVAPTNG